MNLHSLIKLLVVAVVFPAQVNMFQPEDYYDCEDLLDSIIVEIEQPADRSEIEIEEMAPIIQSQEPNMLKTTLAF